MSELCQENADVPAVTVRFFATRQESDTFGPLDVPADRQVIVKSKYNAQQSLQHTYDTQVAHSTCWVPQCNHFGLPAGTGALRRKDRFRISRSEGAQSACQSLWCVPLESSSELLPRSDLAYFRVQGSGCDLHKRLSKLLQLLGHSLLDH